MGGRLVGSQTTNTYVYLFAGARRALENAGLTEEGQFYEVLNCLVLSAFTVEAYLNHLVDHADEFEISLPGQLSGASVWKKFRALSKALGLGDRGLDDSYPEVATLLNFRNTMAHGRTQTIPVDEWVDAEERPPTPQHAYPDWQTYAVFQNAKAAVEKVESLVEALHLAAGQGKFPFLSLGSGFFAFRKETTPPG